MTQPETKALTNSLRNEIVFEDVNNCLTNTNTTKTSAIAWFGSKKHSTSSYTLKPKAISNDFFLSTLVSRLNTYIDMHSTFNASFNSVLINKLPTNQDSIGLHSYNDTVYNPESPLAILTLGSDRCMNIIPSKKYTLTSTNTADVVLSNGSLLILSPITRSNCKYSLPPTNAGSDSYVITFLECTTQDDIMEPINGPLILESSQLTGDYEEPEALNHTPTNISQHEDSNTTNDTLSDTGKINCSTTSEATNTAYPKDSEISQPDIHYVAVDPPLPIYDQQPYMPSPHSFLDEHLYTEIINNSKNATVTRCLESMQMSSVGTLQAKRAHLIHCITDKILQSTSDIQEVPILSDVLIKHLVSSLYDSAIVDQLDRLGLDTTGGAAKRKTRLKEALLSTYAKYPANTPDVTTSLISSSQPLPTIELHESNQELAISSSQPVGIVGHPNTTPNVSPHLAANDSTCSLPPSTPIPTEQELPIEDIAITYESNRTADNKITHAGSYDDLECNGLEENLTLFKDDKLLLTNTGINKFVQSLNDKLVKAELNSHGLHGNGNAKDRKLRLLQFYNTRPISFGIQHSENQSLDSCSKKHNRTPKERTHLDDTPLEAKYNALEGAFVKLEASVISLKDQLANHNELIDLCLRNVTDPQNSDSTNGCLSQCADKTKHPMNVNDTNCSMQLQKEEVHKLSEEVRSLKDKVEQINTLHQYNKTVSCQTDAFMAELATPTDSLSTGNNVLLQETNQSHTGTHSHCPVIAPDFNGVMSIYNHTPELTHPQRCITINRDTHSLAPLTKETNEKTNYLMTFAPGAIDVTKESRDLEIVEISKANQPYQNPTLTTHTISDYSPTERPPGTMRRFNPQPLDANELSRQNTTLNEGANDVVETTNQIPSGTGSTETTLIRHQNSENQVNGSSYSTMLDNPATNQHHSSQNKPAPSIQSSKNRRQSNSSNQGRNVNRKKVMILHDSMLKHFNKTRFTSQYNTVTMKVGSLSHATKHETTRMIRHHPNIECYVIELGINDLRSNSAMETLTSLQQLVNGMQQWSSAKILISLVLLTQTNSRMNDKIKDYNDLVINFVKETRKRNPNIYTIFNKGFLERHPDETMNCYDRDDPNGIHLNINGTSLLAASIKGTLMKISRQTNHHRSHDYT